MQAKLNDFLVKVLNFFIGFSTTKASSRFANTNSGIANFKTLFLRLKLGNQGFYTMPCSFKLGTY
jgi:hypothetical protein